MARHRASKTHPREPERHRAPRSAGGGVVGPDLSLEGLNGVTGVSLAHLNPNQFAGMPLVCSQPDVGVTGNPPTGGGMGQGMDMGAGLGGVVGVGGAV